MILTHKIRIYPNKETKEILNGLIGYSRFCYNRALDLWNKMYDNNENPNGIKIRDYIKSNKKEDWEKKYTPNVLDSSIDDLEFGFKLFYKKINNHPKFKSKNSKNQSFRIYRKNNSTIRILNKKLYLPKIKCGIKMSENLRFNGIIKSCTISCSDNKYFASISVDINDKFNQNKNGKFIGIDLGLKTFAVLGYDDSKYNRKYLNAKGRKKFLNKLYKKISCYQKILSRKIKGSNKYNVTKTKLLKLYLRIKNIQNDYLNKLTTIIIKNFQYITIENLNIKGMMKNHKLAKSIHQSMFYSFKTKLIYKAELYGNKIIIADKFYPSTQRCSHCGYIRKNNEKLKLSDRKYICPKCGCIEDRDNNASYNLKIYGENYISLAKTN